MRVALVTATVLFLAACGLDPAKVPATHVTSADGATMEAGDRISFAVVGATRQPLTARGEPPVPLEVIADVRAEVSRRDLSFVVLTGNYVSRSTTAEWTSFAERWSPVLRGDVLSEHPDRKPALALPGDGEVLGDRKLAGYGAAFSGLGADIGYGRVASWSHFDVVAGGKRWRFVFLDSNRKAMGSRWNEQLYWLPKVVSGDGFDHLLVFMPDPLVTLAKGAASDPQGGPSELLAVVEQHSDLMRLTAVFMGGAATNELHLHGGPFGEAQVLAGNAGISAQTLPLPVQGAEGAQLEEVFAQALLAEFDAWHAAQPFDEKTLALVKGEAPELPAAEFPVQGWWVVEASGGKLDVIFRMRRFDGSFRDLYRARYTRKGGWDTRAAQ